MIGSRNKLRRQGNRFDTNDLSPMENVANLVDVMLVFACALMIAIITFWEVDISNVEHLQKEDLEKVEDLQESVEDAAASNEFTPRGTVYEDPETGEMYIISK